MKSSEYSHTPILRPGRIGSQSSVVRIPYTPLDYLFIFVGSTLIVWAFLVIAFSFIPIPPEPEDFDGDKEAVLKHARKRNRSKCLICDKQDATKPVVIQCGHTFCCICLLDHWRRSVGVDQPSRCIWCKQTFRKIEPLKGRNNEQINEYNDRFNPNRSLSKLRDDTWILFPHLFRTLYNRPNRRSFLGHIGRIIFCAVKQLLLFYWFTMLYFASMTRRLFRSHRVQPIL